MQKVARSVVAGLAVAMAVAGGGAAQGIDGVGRFETPDGNGFCTGTLVAPDLVITAAHCVARYAGEASRSGTAFAFRPGRLRASPAVPVNYVVIHPLYRRALNELQRLRFDLALVQLEAPVPDGVSGALDYGEEAEIGEELFIVSWRGSDAATPRQKGCDVRPGFPGLVTLGCEVFGGESGSPVLRRGADGLEVVAVVSSRSEAFDTPTAQASNVVIRLPALVQELTRARRGEGS